MQQEQNRNYWIIVLTVAVGTFMAALDSSIVNVAIPVIQEYFHVSLSMVEWVITAYLLVVSSLLLSFGRLSDLYGQKKLYLVGMVIFTISSMLCGLAASITQLISFRILQALGAGMMFSAGPAIITNSVPPEKRGQALSFTAVAVSIALVTGPVLGGFLVTVFHWSSIFFINIPIGLAAIYFVIRNIPNDQKSRSIPFDKIGSLLISAALILIIFPLETSGDSSLKPVFLFSMLGAGLITAVIFVLVELKSEHPILDIALFKNRVFAASNVAAAFSFLAQFIMTFLVPFYLQKLRLFTPATAGLLYIPLPLASLVVAPISGMLSDRYDSRYLSTAGMAVMACGLFMLSFLNEHTATAYIIVSMAITGMGSGLFQTPNNSAVLGNVPPQNRGTASGMLATMRNIGMAFGVAISGSLFSLLSKRAEVFNAAKGLTGLQVEQASFIYALHITFLVAGVFALLAMVASFVKGEVKPDIRKQLEGI
jgi:EmrB/QacA subfamily drug resistance transporter